MTLSYSTQIDEAVKQLCGIGYNALYEISKNVDFNHKMLISAEKANLDPIKFAEIFRVRNGFKRIDPGNPSQNMDYNRYRVALIDFVCENNWKINSNFAITNLNDGSQISVGICPLNGGYGFLAALDNGHPCVRMDIGNAITELAKKFNFESQISFKPFENTQDPENTQDLDIDAAPSIRPSM